MWAFYPVRFHGALAMEGIRCYCRAAWTVVAPLGVDRGERELYPRQVNVDRRRPPVEAVLAGHRHQEEGLPRGRPAAIVYP